MVLYGENMRKLTRCVLLTLFSVFFTLGLLSFQPNSIAFRNWSFNKEIHINEAVKQTIIKDKIIPQTTISTPTTTTKKTTIPTTTKKTTIATTTKKTTIATTTKIVSNLTTIPIEAKYFPAKKPLILIWVPTYHKRGWTIPQTETCGGGCDITEDKSKFSKSSAVVFYMKGFTRDVAISVPERDNNQLFVWWCHESPWTVMNYYHKQLFEFDNFINWTMNYHINSNIPAVFIPHSAQDWYLHRVGRKKESRLSELKPVTNDKEFEVMFKQLMEAKVTNRTAAWVGSDCHDVAGAVKRLNFVKEIEEHLPTLELYGKCGTKQLPLENLKFFDFLRTFKFYLAFENTLGCVDYVTEKFWYNSLYAGLVPVVWGTKKQEYEKVAPPGSYIHSEDFDNDPKKLAEYLISLDKDDEAYKQYFNWWKMPGFYPIYKLREPPNPGDIPSNDPFDYEVNGFCNLCKELNKSYDSSVIPSLKEAYYGLESKECYEI